MNARHTRTAGFTLLEVMLVALLMGMIASVVVLTIPNSDPRQKLRQEASRLMGVMQLAQDEAILSGRELGLEITENTYELLTLELEDLRWIPMTEQYAEPYQLEDSITMELTLDGLSTEEDQGSMFESEGLFESDDGLFEGTSFDEEEENARFPQIQIWSSGDVTLFELELTYPEDGQTFRITLANDLLGRIRIKDDDED